MITDQIITKVHDPRARGLAEVVPLTASVKLSKFKAVEVDDLETASMAWRVKGLWPAVGLAFVGGPSMSGKSFLTLDLLARVALGEPVLGKRSKRSGFVYIAAEGAAGAQLRFKGLVQKHGRLGHYARLIPAAPDLRDDADLQELSVELRNVRAEMDANGVELGIVALDTLSAAIPGADENSSQDMSRVLASLQRLAIELGVLVLVVAHTGKDESRGLRGWSGLLANADGVIMLEDPKGSAAKTGFIAKVKDGLSGEAFAFELELVNLGADEDGDPITTRTISYLDAPARSPAGRKPTKAAATANLIMSAYGRVLEAKPQTVWAEGALGRSGVLISDLRAKAFDIGVGPTEPDYPAEATPADRQREKRRWQDTRKIDFDRGLSHLIANSTLRREGALVWELPRKGASSL